MKHTALPGAILPPGTRFSKIHTIFFPTICDPGHFTKVTFWEIKMSLEIIANDIQSVSVVIQHIGSNMFSPSREAQAV